ncbi:hypothetical protein Nepgr_009379 [Nepenthes gracilis]|uniref:Uncharacterized protein n=1 Tax=Nepenthes gracilis TaxID=150966 RepID=A0AAD3SBD3_NEPGR|nr:hypothetical protein Nepgr_009379 [Nepenthes gracilis]
MLQKHLINWASAPGLQKINTFISIYQEVCQSLKNSPSNTPGKTTSAGDNKQADPPTYSAGQTALQSTAEAQHSVISSKPSAPTFKGSKDPQLKTSSTIFSS